MSDIALVTGSHHLPGLAEVDARLTAALTQHGVRVHHPRWDDEQVRWGEFDLALVRTTWDYTERRERFLAWAEQAAERTRLWNPLEVLRWNTHKSYLIELEERGAPVIPTAWMAQGDRVDLAALLASRDWGDVVIKPAVGAGSRGLELVRAGSPAGQVHLDALLERGDAMVQPYLPSIASEGEVSVVVVAGEPSHAVRKRPAEGELRSQPEFGSSITAEELTPELSTLARWVVDATGASLLVARVDLVGVDGSWQLIELEATEPELFLDHGPATAERLAQELIGLLGG